MKDGDKDNRVYFLHIRDSIQRIEKYTTSGKTVFLQDEMIQNAVVWNIGTIGEAVRNVSKSLRDIHPEIPWAKIAAMRNKVIHEYFKVNLDLVWQVVETEIPVLKTQIDAIIKELEGQSKASDEHGGTDA